MKAQKTATTYVVEIRSTSRYGLNEDRYFRTESEARQEIAELKAWFGADPRRTYNLTSHQIILT